MIRLDLPKAPYWMDLPHGVRLFVRPLSTTVYEAARARGARTARALLEEHAEIAAVGGNIEGLPDLSSEDAAAGLSQLIFAQALARTAIIRWEGVVDGEGSPAEVNDRTVNDLMLIHRMAEAFVLDYTRTHERLLVEGNASGLSPSGTSAVGPATATGADGTSSPAPRADGGPAASAALI